MRVALHTLGCKLNFSETSTVARQFRDRGWKQVDFDQPAEVYVLNTCSVTENADKKCRKAVRQALKIRPDAFIIIMGCYAQLKPVEIAGIPGVDLVLGAKEKFNLFDHIDVFQKQPGCRVLAGEIGEVNSFVNAYSLGDRTRSFLKIQDGCDYKCTFCTIPMARGKSRSDELENILENARKIGESGVREIVLTGVNIGDYGKNQPGTLLDVIQALDQVDIIDRFRISSIEPNLCTDEIISFVAASRRFMPHFHIPLQSGNNELLAAMKRRYQRELYIDRVARIRSLMPHACIGVDVIVGFPGETEAHFLDTYHFLNELEISYLHVFTYSERPNTEADKMEMSVPVEERNLRSKKLRILSEKKKRAFYNQFLGQERIVLFEADRKEDILFGFTDNYIKTIIPFDISLINTLQTVKLGSPDREGNLVATPIPSPQIFI